LVLIAPAAFAVTSMSVTMAAAASVVSFGLPTLTSLAMTVDSIRALGLHLRAAVRFGASSAVTCLGFGGLFAFSPALAWATLAAYAVTAAWACSSRSAVHASSTPHESEESAAGLHASSPEEIRSMSDAELCQAWRRSFATLMSTHSVGRRAVVVSLRQVLLDEMDVRHPTGLQAWLLSGAGAGGGPEQFLGHGDEGGATQAA
jgi:hypothetical protein